MFGSLVAALGDEPVGILIAARALELAVKGVIVPHLRLRLDLDGLTAASLEVHPKPDVVPAKAGIQCR